MSTDYNYDEQGQFFPYFILTISGLVTLPLTYSLLNPSTEDPENTAPRISSDYKPPHADLIQGQKKKQRRRERKVKRMITVVVGWLVMGWMAYLMMVTATTTPQIWDPYDILGISRSATEKSIKSHYKRLSLKFHPDKIRPDSAKNETLETLNDRFVELTKAYKALTDEEVRNNYIQYGHPDGKQSFSIGIALPKFIVTEGNGKYVLLVYGLLLGVLLPYVVGKWWYGTQRMTKDKVLIASASNLFREYEDDLSEGGVVGALSSGEEFKEVLKGNKADAGLAKVEGRILSEDGLKTVGTGFSSKGRKKLQSLDEGARRKALGLLWAYLGRVDLGDALLNDEKYEAAPIALALNEALRSIGLAYGNTAPILSSFRTSQNLIQAIAPGASPLLQLPYITPSVVQSIEGAGTKTHFTVQQYLRLSEDKRRRLTVGPSLLSEAQYKTTVSVARQIPLLKVEKAFFKVMGERFITPSSLVQLVIKARVLPPGATKIPPINELDLEDVDPAEGDLDAILGRKPSKAKSKDPSSKPPTTATPDDGIQPPLAHAPFFARDHSPRWHVFLTDSKQGKIAVPPTAFVTFDKPPYEDDVDGRTPTYNMQTLKMQFQAPTQAGQYTFVMHLVCDSYIGMDTAMGITLAVEEMTRAEEISSEDDISEPEEDSIAGQMNALKTGGLAGAAAGGGAGGGRPAAKRVKSKKQAARKADDDDDSSSDESDTEGEEGQADDGDTDTDTDTDEE
ncbi:MAG: secretory subunit [Piccolia ochrophora]|nr:MAG: secretory subunit [Piccolia ochrophora]